ncbi:DUF6168 family protein [Olleya sp. 1-3]|uniref:DUF6168 family protein n=1 Tax=Olleya sp. 1-3 TaxID=2058323 RepID=UPI000C31F0C7|nr:DUF6168 family protein [Olleya sp. 1-3]PKG52080.1 hypothetical protein CXF54_05865 [Olleya sp. 1-3]
MNKRILYVVASILVILVVAYNLQSYLTDDNVPYSLQKLYIFHGIAVLIVYLGIEIIHDKMPNQIGTAYLTLMFLKIGTFILLFKSTIFSIKDLTLTDRLGLVIPFFLFLIAETACIAKLLKSK